MTFEEAQSAVDNATWFTCTIIDCSDPATHREPLDLCQKHFDEWELHDAEYQADIAAERLAAVQKKHQRKMRLGNDMTERIKDTFRELLNRG